MRILHYLHGMPPVRKGGLIKYVMDLSAAQCKKNDVIILYPGPLSRNPQNRVNVSVQRNGKKGKVRLFRICNPLPVPMTSGILETEKFMLKCDRKIYLDFLNNLKPDIIQMHSLMGLHAEFVQAANELGIPVVYTTHDYFGLCPTVNMYHDGGICEKPGERCWECSKYAYLDRRMVLEQSALYRCYSHQVWLMRLLQMKCLKNAFKSIRSKRDTETTALPEAKKLPDCDYSVLLDYYRRILAGVDYYHFNSEVARQVYESCLGKCNGEILYVSNANVKDCRQLHSSNGKLKIGFLGGNVAFKGLDTLRQACSELYAEGKTELELQIYGSTQQDEEPFCKYYKPYRDRELDSVYQNMDVLAVPSKWPETFAMVVAEALAHGVPVLLTEHVGAKMLIEKSDKPIGRILKDDKEAWKLCICDLYDNRVKIQEYSKNICDSDMGFDYSEYVDDVQKMLDKVVLQRDL